MEQKKIYREKQKQSPAEIFFLFGKYTYNNIVHIVIPGKLIVCFEIALQNLYIKHDSKMKII